MRASFWVIGPLLARMHEARVSLPGGCAIGTRPVDLFLMGLERLGARIDVEGGYVVAKAPGGLVGNRVVFPKVSVGATHVIMMAATLAKGETVIENAAREPEVVDLARCLSAMGARISGAGTSTIVIEGVDRLRGARHRVVADRIETGTYAMAVAMTGGDVLLEGAEASLLEAPIEVLRRVGTEIDETNSGLRVRRNGAGIVASRRGHRSFPRVPHRSAGAVHGADDPGARHGPASPRPFSRTASCTSPSWPASVRASASRGRSPPSRGSSGSGARP